MADPRLFRLRVTFHETGRLAMLSHLELARALERAVRRAQLPFAVSQGFSPHMRKRSVFCYRKSWYSSSLSCLFSSIFPFS